MSAESNDENDVVTISDIIEYETRNLAGCDNDDSCCTFPKGYVYRQALYLCITCLKLTGKPAGICYPCSIHCHNDHELLDLFTKRKFRCDCGNGNFPKGSNCKLWEDKDDVNKDNSYNHNYSGFFCACASEYKECEENEDMYQCNICEDWFHLSHLSDNIEELTLHKVDVIEGFKEFTCKACMGKCEYLRTYNQYYINKLIQTNLDSVCCKFTTINEALKEITSPIKQLSCGAFWPEDWREILCKCPTCKSSLDNVGIGFLLDPLDPISHYYEQANTEQNTEEVVREVISSMPHTQAIVFARGFAEYREALSQFLSEQDPDKVVTSDDVKSFFDNIKRRRLDDDDEGHLG